MKYFFRLFMLLIFLFMVNCTISRVGLENSQEPTKRLGSSSFIRENRDLAIVVDVELTRRRLDEHYFPLGIKIANKNLETLTLDRDSLILVDEHDDIYYMPEVVELQAYYNKLAPDHKFKSQTGLMVDQLLTSFSYFMKAESNFFPQTQGAGRIIEMVYIRKKSYMEDLIYFPMPPGGIKGKLLRLRLETPQLEIPYEIAFIVD